MLSAISMRFLVMVGFGKSSARTKRSDWLVGEFGRDDQKNRLKNKGDEALFWCSSKNTYLETVSQLLRTGESPTANMAFENCEEIHGKEIIRIIFFYKVSLL